MKYPNVATILGFLELGTMTAMAVGSLLDAVIDSGEDISDDTMAELQGRQNNNHARLQSLLRREANESEPAS